MDITQLVCPGNSRKVVPLTINFNRQVYNFSFRCTVSVFTEEIWDRASEVGIVDSQEIEVLELGDGVRDWAG